MPQTVYSKIDDALEGEAVDEAIWALVFALAETVALATDYKFEEDANTKIAAMTRQAYDFICSTQTTTVQ